MAASTSAREHQQGSNPPLGGPRVSAILVSYNTRDLLERALKSVLRPAGGFDASGAPEVEVLVVDNASSDGSAEMVRERFPEVMLLASTRNGGFAWGVNQALERAGGDFILLLNPDAEMEPGALEKMVRFLQANPRVAAVGPRLVYGDGSPQHAAFRFPTLAMVFLDFFPLHWRLLNSRLNGRYPATNVPHPIDHPLGACMLIRREALEQVGPMDERFFMYCEEVDWCMRARAAGWEVYHLPQAVAMHLGGQSTQQRRSALFAELHRSRSQLYRKHYGPVFRLLARLITQLGLVVEEKRARAQVRAGQLTAEDLEKHLQALNTIRAVLRSGG